MNSLNINVTTAPAANALRLIGLAAPERKPSKIEPGQYAARAGDVAAAAAAVVLAGGDPLEDADVQRLIMAERLTASGLFDAVRAAEDRAYLDQWREAAPELRRQTIEKFDAAVGKMKAGAERLPDLDMNAAALNLANLEPADAALAVTTIQAHSEVETIRSEWVHLLSLDTGMAHPNGHTAPLLWLDLTAEELDTYHQRDNAERVLGTNTPEHRMHTRTSWDVLREGMTLALAADAAEFAERVQAVNDQRAETDAQRRQEARRRGAVFI